MHACRPEVRVGSTKIVCFQFHRKNCSSGNVLYQCDVCFADGFVNKITLNNHIKAKHSDERSVDSFSILFTGRPNSGLKLS